MIDRWDFWVAVIGLGVATYAIRLSFLALTQKRDLPPVMRQLLDFVPVTVLPALVVPLIVYPPATGGEIDPPRLIAAALALGIGIATRSVMTVLVTGMVALWVLRWGLG